MRDLVLGYDPVWKRKHLVPAALRYRHAALLGKTGAGKSALLHRLIYQDAKQPDAATIVFDAGDLVSDLVASLPDRVMERVVSFTLARPIPFNPLLRRRDEPGRLKNELTALLDGVVVDSSSTAPVSARMSRLLGAALRLVLTEPAPTLSSLLTCLFREQATLARALQIPDFGMTRDALADRLSFFLGDPRIRRVLCAGHELDFGRLIDERRIALFSFAGLEPPMKRFLGTLFLTALTSTVLERPKAERAGLALYVDEAGDYVQSALTTQLLKLLFAQGRKFRTSLTLAYTDYGVMPRELLHTIESNAATLMAFSCGTPESRAMSELFGAKQWPAELISFLPDRQAIARVGDAVVRFATLPPPQRVRTISEPTAPTRPDPPDPFDSILAAPPPRAPRRPAQLPHAAA